MKNAVSIGKIISSALVLQCMMNKHRCSRLAMTGLTQYVVLMQEELRPLLLRRMKEDVENLPEKEEVIVWVELTDLQRAYYKALYLQQVLLYASAAA